MADVAVEVEVSGMVQGVGFRYSCQVQANRLRVRGWVRNNDFEGTVTGHFEGEPDAVQQLVDWCRQGPPSARVHTVDVQRAAAQGLTGFTVAG